MIGLLAHAAPINYKFPLPIWLYVAAGGAAVLLSAPAAALAVTESTVVERRGPDVYRFFRRAGPILTVVGVVLILVALVGGLFSTTDESQEFFENPVLVLTWVDRRSTSRAAPSIACSRATASSRFAIPRGSVSGPQSRCSSSGRGWS
jgi:hypothetical protein